VPDELDGGSIRLWAVPVGEPVLVDGDLRAAGVVSSVDSVPAVPRVRGARGTVACDAPDRGRRAGVQRGRPVDRQLGPVPHRAGQLVAGRVVQPTHPPHAVHVPGDHPVHPLPACCLPAFSSSLLLLLFSPSHCLVPSVSVSGRQHAAAVPGDPLAQQLHRLLRRDGDGRHVRETPRRRGAQIPSLSSLLPALSPHFIPDPSLSC